MIELKPCPFCGKSVAKAGTIIDLDISECLDNWDKTHYTVICSYNKGGCGMTLGWWYETEESAIDAWKRRADNADN